ncbi:MAG: hypothetical protein KC731_17740 [Myxococcales bacterium]|nr:hypothetical protein [Myxococcales bacterium]
MGASVLLLVACGQKPPAEAPDPEPDLSSSDDPEPTPVETSDTTPEDDGPTGDDAPPPKPAADPGSDDIELTYRDCATIARAYGQAWLNDEKQTLDGKGLKKPQYDKMLAQLEEDSAGMEENYRSECDKTVGTAMLRSRLVCAVKAKTMARFDACLDGKAQ